jgi:hypothetical protein
MTPEGVAFDPLPVETPKVRMTRVPSTSRGAMEQIEVRPAVMWRRYKGTKKGPQLPELPGSRIRHGELEPDRLAAG